MDKETLSNYGWIVICVLVLAVMLALSSPFGTFVASGVKSTTQGLFDTNQKALNTTGLASVESQDFNGSIFRNATIPNGGTYQSGSKILSAGEKFPDAPATGDIYKEGDYTYRYNYRSNGSSWVTNTTQNGWGVRVQDTTKSSYGEIISEIAGKPVSNMTYSFYNCASLTVAPTIPNSVKSLAYTFQNCTSLTKAPAIPDSVTNMSNTFYNCKSLKIAPAIPNSVTNIEETFGWCTSLATAPTIPNNVTSMWCTFYNCKSLKIAPAIPNSVTNMWATFDGCKSLTIAPTIPNGVTNMQATFQGCTSLTAAPSIPNGVTNMHYTFKNCTSLTTAPTIPNSVEQMTETFYGSTSLTGTIEINANPINYSRCLYYTKITTVIGSTPYKSQILATKY